MILITKSNELDITTELIVSWLSCKNAKYTLINLDDSNIYKSLNNYKSVLKIEPESQLNYSCVWFWRAFPKSQIQRNDKLKRYLQNESLTIIKYLLGQNQNKCTWFPKKIDFGINKLEVLNKASKIGLLIPKTIITNNKNDLIEFFNENKTIITKPIYEVDSWEFEENNYTLFTEEIKKDNLLNIPNTFFPSLFQEKIIKEFEIRTFYLDGTFFSMAIFSQDNEKTEVDFRKYDTENENRVTVFKLPEDIQMKLTDLMKEIGMQSGSIDLIYNGENKYYFLEVNPVGQIDMVSKPCNYYIEKKIAEKLRKYEEIK